MHGLVETDNASYFTSGSIKAFLHENGIKLLQSSPYWSRHNGLVENFNKSIRKAVRIAQTQNKNRRLELYIFPLHYRATEQSTTWFSPVQLLYNMAKQGKKVHGVPQSQAQPTPDTKRKRKHKTKHAQIEQFTKSTKISSLFPKRGNRKAKRTEKHKNKITQDKTQNKSPRRINHKATKSKTNTGTTAPP